MSSLLSVNFASIHLLIQCSAVAFNLRIRKLVPVAENEDTHPIISQNGFDGIVLDHVVSVK